MKSFDSVRKRAARRRYAHLNPVKLKAIDTCFDELGCRSFADLGGVWGVDGGYARYAADCHRAEAGVLVDDDFTGAYLRHSQRLPRLTHVRGSFGDREVARALGEFDVAFFFDVLLHQVDPDWDEILWTYAAQCRCMAIVEPHWNGPETVRLLELGEEEYLASVPSDDEIYEGLWQRLDEVNPHRGRRWADVHDIWQWGLTDRDVIQRMADLGFGLRLFENTGRWHGLERFHESAFVFDRATPVV